MDEKLVSRIEKVVKQCFGVTDSDRAPTFLEGIAMSLGNPVDGISVSEALSDISRSIGHNADSMDNVAEALFKIAEAISIIKEK